MQSSRDQAPEKRQQATRKWLVVGGLLLVVLGLGLQALLRPFDFTFDGWRLPPLTDPGARVGVEPGVEVAVPDVATPTTAEPSQPASDPDTFTVAVTELKTQTTDAAALETLRWMHGLFVAELGTIANIVIVEWEGGELDFGFPGSLPVPGATLAAPIELPDGVDYVIEVSGEYQSDGQPAWRFGAGFASVAGGGGHGNFGRPGDFTDPDAARDAVAFIVRFLRERIFPPDPAILQEFQTRVLDPNASEAERMAALEAIGRWASTISPSGGGAPTDAETRFVNLARAMLTQSTDPEIRYRILNRMSLIDYEDLIPAIVDTALYDSTGYVRLEAVRALGRRLDAVGDASARAALEYAAGSDESEQVRTQAQWMVASEQGRRALIAATLANPGLTDGERMALFDADISGLAWYLDEPAVVSLLEITARSSDPSAVSVTRYELDRADPAVVVPVLLDQLRYATDATVRATAAAALGSQAEAADVRTALENASASDASAEVREAAASAL